MRDVVSDRDQQHRVVDPSLIDTAAYAPISATGDGADDPLVLILVEMVRIICEEEHGASHPAA